MTNEFQAPEGGAEDLRIALAQRDIAIEGRDREAAKAKAMRAALDFAAGAIGDAIYTEDGLDGDAGQRVLHIITEARELGTFDQQQFGALDHLCPFTRAEKAEAALAAQAPAEGDDDWRHLKDYGYAPGGYMTRCRTCGDTPTMDKRAWRCRPCAEAAYANGQAQREQEAEAAIDAEQGPLLVAARKVIAGSQSLDSCHGGYVVPAELWLALQGEVMEQLREHARRAFNSEPKGTGEDLAELNSTLLAECDRLRGNLKSVWAKTEAAAERRGFRLVMQMPQEHVELIALQAPAPAPEPYEYDPEHTPEDNETFKLLHAFEQYCRGHGHAWSKDRLVAHLWARFASPAVGAEPLFWYRPCGDGLYEGPVHHKSVGGKMLRDEKPGEWVALYPAAGGAA